MLRRRYQPQTQTARKAERGQETPQNGRQRGNSTGSLYGGVVIGGVIAARARYSKYLTPVCFFFAQLPCHVNRVLLHIHWANRVKCPRNPSAYPLPTCDVSRHKDFANPYSLDYSAV